MGSSGEFLEVVEIRLGMGATEFEWCENDVEIGPLIV
jgi:hypothetical protein